MRYNKLCRISMLKYFFKQQFVSHSPCLSKFFNWSQRLQWKHQRLGFVSPYEKQQKPPWAFQPAVWGISCLFLLPSPCNDSACTYHSAIFVKWQQWPTPSESVAIYCVRKLVSCITHLQSLFESCCRFLNLCWIKNTNQSWLQTSRRCLYAFLTCSRPSCFYRVVTCHHHWHVSSWVMWLRMLRATTSLPIQPFVFFLVLQRFSPE